jgi:anti-sigma-K factor RskA
MIMNDDILTLYYYQDGLTETERLKIQSALGKDATLRARYEQLCEDLARFDAPNPVAVAADVTARWHDSIDRAARLERQHKQPAGRVLHLPSFAWGTVVAAALVVGIGLGFYLSEHREAEPVIDPRMVVDVPPETRSPSVAFARGLLVHLRESRQELSALPASAAEERAMLIMHMIQQNRLFERAAEQNDADDLARVLRAFEPILMRLAANDMTAEDAEALQAQLAFELNVMLTKLGKNASESTGPI